MSASTHKNAASAAMRTTWGRLSAWHKPDNQQTGAHVVEEAKRWLSSHLFALLSVPKSALICSWQPDDLWAVLLMALLANHESAVIILPDRLTLQTLKDRLSQYPLHLLRPTFCLSADSSSLPTLMQACQQWRLGHSQLMMTTVDTVLSPEVFATLRQNPPSRWILPHAEMLLPETVWPESSAVQTKHYARLAKVFRTHANWMTPLVCLAPLLSSPLQDMVLSTLALPVQAVNVSSVPWQLPKTMAITVCSVKSLTEQQDTFWKIFQSVQGLGGSSGWLLTARTRHDAHLLAQRILQEYSADTTVWVLRDRQSVQKALSHFEKQPLKGPRFMVTSHSDTPTVLASMAQSSLLSQEAFSWVLWDDIPSLSWLRSQVMRLFTPGAHQRSSFKQNDNAPHQLVILNRFQARHMSFEMASLLQTDQCHTVMLEKGVSEFDLPYCEQCSACKRAHQQANRWWRRKVTQLFG
ncbi:MAG: hypothetical protein VKK59_05140 [Vampirovibrionales bacterium]|nr:hypothetical protein [Vampirovibrionales bacterium]